MNNNIRLNSVFCVLTPVNLLFPYPVFSMKRSKTQKNMYCMVIFILHLRKGKIYIVIESRSVVD